MTVNTFSDRVGTYSIWAAIWSSVKISTAGCAGGNVSYKVDFTNNSTGFVDFIRSGLIVSTGTLNTVIDEDWAAFSTVYTVTLTVTDGRGNVEAQRNLTDLTPALGAPVTP